MRKIYIIDTSVLAYDPYSYTNFSGNDVVIPISVLDELDKLKNLPNEAGKNARVCIRALDSICSQGEIHKGIQIENDILLKIDTINNQNNFGSDSYIDNKILACAFNIGKDKTKTTVLVSKDINLRIRARAFDIKAEDYEKDKIPVQDLYSGYQIIKSEEIGDLLANKSQIDYKLYDELHGLLPNECVHLVDANEDGIAIGRRAGDKIKLISDKNPWGLDLRNKEQAFAVDLLCDPRVSLVTLIGKAGTGKAEPLDAKLLTPNGWIYMGEVKIGDKIIGSNGKETTVTGVFPQGKKNIYKVTFTDGSSVECCDEHLWLTKTSLERDQLKQGKIRSLKEIIPTLRYGKQQKRNHSIPIVKPVEFKNQEIDINPYLLGVLLGDGCLTSYVGLTTSDVEIINKCAKTLPKEVTIKRKKNSNIEYIISRTSKSGNNILLDRLRNLDLIGKKSFEKSIPNKYLYNSIENRLSILQGLMDTDGFCAKTPNRETVFYTTSIQLAKDVQFIAQSLGGTAKLINKQTKFSYKGNKKEGRPSFALYIVLPKEFIPFTLKRKVERYKANTKYIPRRYIESVEYVDKKEAQCISVSANDHLYVTDHCIVTHNTLAAVASGLEMVLEKKLFNKLVIYRPIQPVGNDIGYLPGTMEEKLAPWMSAISDSFEFLFEAKSGNKWKTMFDMYVEKGKIQMEAITYVRGRSIPNAFIIVDEAQNLSKEEVKTILTRASNGTKVVLTGDIEQIDNSFLDATNNGLSYVVEKFKDSDLAGHITFTKGERSALASEAAKIL